MPRIPRREGYERMRKRLAEHMPHVPEKERTRIAQEANKRLDRKHNEQGKGRGTPEL